MITLDQLARTIEKISVQSVLLDSDNTDDLISIVSLFEDIHCWAQQNSQPVLANALKKFHAFADRQIQSGFLSHEQFLSIIEKTISEIQIYARHDFDFSTCQFPPELDDEYTKTDIEKCPEVEPPENMAVIQSEKHLRHPGTLPGYLDMDLFAEFLSLQTSILEKIESLGLRIEQSPGNDDIVEIKRTIHTMKGEAGFLNLNDVESLCHSFEDLISTEELFLKYTDTLFAVIDWLRKAFSWYRGENPEQPVSSKFLVDSINSLINQVPLLEEQSESTLDGNQDISPLRGGKEDNLPSTSSLDSSKRIKDSILVDTERLDRIIDMIGELVISQSMIMQADEIKAIESQELKRHLIQMGKITRGLQETSHTLRMVPIKSSFQKMARLVRDISKKSGKKIQCELSGIETELDKTIIDKINDPLLHIIRNAVDHGIEDPDSRIRVGKNPVGAIRLNAYHKSGYILIEIEDDGRGIDRKSILKKAVETSIIQKNDVLNDRDITQLMFEPGFSTATEITDLSGRGVGMNVVKETIDSLHGSIDFHSTAGKGSTFIIKIPLTLAIIDGMIVRSGKDKFIIPALSIVTTTRIAKDKITKLINTSRVVDVLDQLIPLFSLSSLLGMADDDKFDNDQLTIVIVEGHNRRLAIIVDELIGKQQIVIKSLGESFHNIQGISGASIMPDGQVGLIVDIEKLISSHMLKMES